MEYLIIFGLVTIYALYVLKKKSDDDRAFREISFRATMLSLEEKAKREGTFVISYFDSEKK